MYDHELENYLYIYFFLENGIKLPILRPILPS